MELRFDDFCGYVGIYHPWHGGKNNRFDRFSSYILDVKNHRSPGMDYFLRVMQIELEDMTDTPQSWVFVSVPSTKAGVTNQNGIAEFCRRLAIQENQIDGTSCLLRHTSVQSAHSGGPRTVDTHLQTIMANDIHIFKKRSIILFDDVTTSGSSLCACETILRRAGANTIALVALGVTNGFQDIIIDR